MLQHHLTVRRRQIELRRDEGITVRLSDFGLAKAVNPMTLLASARGTISFKPPEALDGMDSCAADVWSVGVRTSRTTVTVETTRSISTSQVKRSSAPMRTPPRPLAPTPTVSAAAPSLASPP